MTLKKVFIIIAGIATKLRLLRMRSNVWIKLPNQPRPKLDLLLIFIINNKINYNEIKMAWSPESSLPPVTDANSLSSVWRRFEWITCRIFLWEFFGSRNWWSKWGQKERLVLAQWRSSHWSQVIVYVFFNRYFNGNDLGWQEESLYENALTSVSTFKIQ